MTKTPIKAIKSAMGRKDPEVQKAQDAMQSRRDLELEKSRIKLTNAKKAFEDECSAKDEMPPPDTFHEREKVPSFLFPRSSVTASATLSDNSPVQRPLTAENLAIHNNQIYHEC